MKPKSQTTPALDAVNYAMQAIQHEWTSKRQQRCSKCGRWKTIWVERQACDRIRREGNAA